MIDEKRLTVCTLSLLLAFAHASMVAGTSLRASDHIRINNRNRIKTVDSIRESVTSYNKMNTIDIFQHAVKVEKGYLRSRMLDEAAEENNKDDEGSNDENAEDDEEDQGDNEKDEEEEGEEKENEEEDAGNDDAGEIEEEDENGDDAVADEENDDAADEEEEEDNGDDDEGEEDNDEEEEENNNGEEAQNDDAQEENEEEDDEEEEDEDSESEDESEDQQVSIDFLKCVAFSIDPNVANLEAMLKNGEIDEDELEQLEKILITEMTSDLNTQESVVFFTVGYGTDDEDRELFMVNINNWIEASSGYDQTCNALDEDDVETVFSKISSKASVQQYSEHVWYSGFNCKADGEGFKPQIFLDDTCNTFSSTMNQYYPFRKATDDGSTQVGSDLTQYTIEDANESIEESQYCDESEFCDQIFEKSIELATCEGRDDKERRLASYQLEYDVASNIGDACPYIQASFGLEEENEYSIEEIENMVVLWSNMKNGGQESDRRSIIPGTNNVWLYLSGLLIIICIGICLTGATKSSSVKKSSSSDTDDTKREPLVAKSNDTKKEPLVAKSIPHSESDIVEAYSAIECTLARKRTKPEPEKREKRKTKTSEFREYLKNSISKESSKTEKSEDEARITASF